MSNAKGMNINMKVNNAVYDSPAMLVEVTRKCNNHCNYCAGWRNNKLMEREMLSTDIYKKIFQAMRNINFSRITFTGGEPTIRKDLYDIINCAITLNPKKEIHIHTNGSLILENKQIWTLPIKAVKININTIDRITYQKITGNDGLNKVLKGIDYLREREVPLRLHAVVSEVSYDSMFQLIDYCIENQIDLKIFEIDTSLSSFDKKHVDMKKIVSFIEEKSNNRLEYKTPGLPVISYSFEGETEVQVVLANTPQYSEKLCKNCEKYACNYGLYTASISPEGFCYPCLINEKAGRVKLNLEEVDEMYNQIKKIYHIVKEKS